jgi:predicted Zn finger-like uncharacterized protein
MIIICEECGRKYRIDPAKIAGDQSKFKCKTCEHLITVRKPTPRPEAETEEQPLPSIFEAQVAVDEKPAAAVHSAEKTGQKKQRLAFERSVRARFGLTAKIFSMMIIVSLIPLAMFWGINLKQTKERMRNDIKKNTNQITINISRNVEEWLEKNDKILKILTKMESLISMDRLKQEPLLNAVRKVYPWIYFMFTIDVDGRNVARNDGRPLQSFSDKQYFKDVMDGKAIAWQITIDETSKQPALILAVPIYRYDEIIGVVASALSLDDLADQLVTWGGDDTDFAFMVDDKGKVIVHKNKKYILQQKNLGQHPLIVAFKNGQRGTVSYTDHEGKSILGHARGTALGWIIAFQREEKEAFFVTNQVMSHAYLLLGVTVAFVFIVAWFSGRAFARPIIKLADAANRISVGELETDIDTQRKDEIGDLAEAIARMQDSICLGIERLRQRR